MTTLRIRLNIAYRGTNFHGWATQPGLRTVQGQIEAALAIITRQQLSLTVAGRTDAGVHARGQVAHFDIEQDTWESLLKRSKRHAEEAFCRRLNAVIGQISSPKDVSHSRGIDRDMGKPNDILIRSTKVVSADFDARFSALWRRYCYRIADNNQACDPLQGDFWWCRQALDVQEMEQAAAALVGEHDFRSFCKPREGATTIRTLEEFSFSRTSTGMIQARVRADAFCHCMVRSLVGACVPVGSGKRSWDWPRHLLDQGQRTGLITIAPARGLTLEEVAYPAPDHFGARAQLTRARRDCAR